MMTNNQSVNRWYQVIRMLFTSIKPMLLSMKREAFNDDNYIFEPKWNGWRILIHKQGQRVEAYTRHGRNVTAKFPELETLRESIKAHTTVLDCEGVCIRDGRSVFDDFQYRGRLTSERKIQSAITTHPVTFIAFDVLMSEDVDRTQEPLMDRKCRLTETILPSEQIAPTMFLQGAGRNLKKLTEDRGWEGIVAKGKTSRYTLNVRSIEWLKIKNWRTIDTVILGYRTEPHFALIVGLNFSAAENMPVATVEYGFTPEEKIAFRNVVGQLHTVKDRYAQWIEPRICCSIRYLERTENHSLCMATFEKFLLNKLPDEYVWGS